MFSPIWFTIFSTNFRSWKRKQTSYWSRTVLFSQFTGKEIIINKFTKFIIRFSRLVNLSDEFVKTFLLTAYWWLCWQYWFLIRICHTHYLAPEYMWLWHIFQIIEKLQNNWHIQTTFHYTANRNVWNLKTCLQTHLNSQFSMARTIWIFLKIIFKSDRAIISLFCTLPWKLGNRYYRYY